MSPPCDDIMGVRYQLRLLLPWNLNSEVHFAAFFSELTFNYTSHTVSAINQRDLQFPVRLCVLKKRNKGLATKVGDIWFEMGGTDAIFQTWSMYCRNRNINTQTCGVLWCIDYVTAVSEFAPHCHRLGPAVTLKWVIYFSKQPKT